MLVEFACLAAAIGCWVWSGAGPTANTNPSRPTPTTQRGDTPAAVHLDASSGEFERLLRVTNRIYTGSEPHTREDFDALAAGGVSTVVSVDGVQPKVSLASQSGLRYVHIPIGYDGISTESGQSLARLVQDCRGGLFIHCHHGVHRGPAAAVIAAIAEGAMSREKALQFLRKAGTSRKYEGLWRDVAAYRRPPTGTPLPKLVASASVNSMAAAMAELDRDWERLQVCAKHAWRTPESHPDLSPKHQALLVKEAFREMSRLLDTSGRAPALAAELRQTAALAAALEESLERGDRKEADRQLHQIAERCTTCHSRHRDR